MYTYDKIDKISIHDFILPDKTIELIRELKRLLLIYEAEPLKLTVINKPTDYCATICKLLNKLTEANYEKLKNEMFVLLESIHRVEDIDIITNRIFHIASSNIHLSKLFSKLYNELIKKNKAFYDIFQDHFLKHCKTLSEIKYISPNDNYDEYCNYVKSIDRLKSGLSFFSNLMRFKICTIEHMIGLCKELLQTLIHEMQHELNMEYKEELLQSIFIIIKETHEELFFHSQFESIYNKIVSLKENPHINMKLKFKIMDIIDFVKH
jgi:hypothetical protein